MLTTNALIRAKQILKINEKDESSLTIGFILFSLYPSIPLQQQGSNFSNRALW